MTTFEKELAPPLLGIQAAVRRLLEEVGESVSPRELQRRLGIDYRLSWRATRIAAAPDPMAVGVHVPTAAALRRLVKAASAAGAGEETGGALLAAEKDLRRLIDKHAPERGFFEVMAGSLSSGGTAALDTDLKRAAYRTSCQIRGRMIDTSFVMWLIAPGHEPGFADCVGLRGILGYLNLRPGAAVRLTGYQHRDDDEAGAREPRATPLPEVIRPVGMGMGVVERFSTPSLPLEVVPGEDGYRDVYLTTPGVGRSGALDVVLASVERGVPVREPDSAGDFDTKLHMQTRTPTRVLVFDVAVHEALYATGDAEATVLDGPPPNPLSAAGSLSELPIQESVACLGRGGHALHCPDVPRYTELLRSIAEPLGWDLEEFRVFRCRVEFPVLYSTIRIRLGG